MQIGLALHHYAAEHNVLPPGVVNETGPVESRPPGSHFGWLVQILPCFDQRELFQMIDFREGVYGPANQTVGSVRLGVLMCPDDSSNPRGGVPGLALSSYAACHHDSEAPIDTTNHGVMYLNSRVRMDDVTDGLSHTIFVGEIFKAHPLGWMSGTRATLRNTGHPINRIDPAGLGVGLTDYSLFSRRQQDLNEIEGLIESRRSRSRRRSWAGSAASTAATGRISPSATARSASSGRRWISRSTKGWATVPMGSRSMTKPT